MNRVLIVCPSVTAEHAELFCASGQAALDKGVELRPVLVANSRATQALAARWPQLVVPGTNAGFAASINQGAAAGGEFDWLVIANDDCDYDADRIVRLVGHLAAAPADGHRLIRLAREEPWRPIPGVGGVFAILSLLERIPFALGRRLETETSVPPAPDRYLPLGLVAVSAPLWRDTGGLEEALPFCFEDAWFGRQVRARGGGVRYDTFESGLHHLLYSSTASRIDVVLPTIAWSGLVYLRLIGVPSVVARVVCVLALLVRAPLSLLGRAHRGRHLLGITRSVRAILADRRPGLPPP